MSHQRLAQLIQAHQAALLVHLEAQATHEAIINLLQGVESREITWHSACACSAIKR